MNVAIKIYTKAVRRNFAPVEPASENLRYIFYLPVNLQANGV